MRPTWRSDPPLTLRRSPCQTPPCGIAVFAGGGHPLPSRRRTHRPFVASGEASAVVHHIKFRWLMSALGQKQTLGRLQLMSALPPKADIGTEPRNVRYVPIADIQRLIRSACRL